MLCNWSSIGICCSGGKKVRKKFMALLIATVVPCSLFLARCGCLLGERNGILLWFSYMSDRPKDKLNTNYQKDKHKNHCAVHGYVPSCMFLHEKVNLEQTNSYSGPELSPCDIV
jgi:hypothetical protein